MVEVGIIADDFVGLVRELLASGVTFDTEIWGDSAEILGNGGMAGCCWGDVGVPVGVA